MFTRRLRARAFVIVCVSRTDRSAEEERERELGRNDAVAIMHRGIALARGNASSRSL